MNAWRRARALVLLSLLGCFVRSIPAFAQTAPALPPALAAEQSMGDAWWTGPMLANSAETLPPGHFLFEPYLYDIRSPRSDSFGSRTYILYGLVNRLSVGIIPVFGYNRLSNAPSSSGVGTGDLTVEAQYRLTEFQQGGWLPTTAIQLQETLPSGRYDELGNRSADGLGAGTYTTMLALNSQTYVWLPNGRILRVRFDVSEAFSQHARLRDVSVYGTSQGFRGDVQPGNGFSADLAFEYSLTERWVLALDATYSHDGNTRVTGEDTLGFPNMPYASSVRLNSGPSEAFSIAPAIEYNWSTAIGVLLGTRVIFGGHNNTGSVTPAIALNYVY